MIPKSLYLLSAALLLAACTSQNGEDLAGDDPLPTPSCDTSHVTYVLTVAPLLRQNCSRCHSSAVASGGVDLSTYAQVRALAADGRLLGTVSHDPGFDPMPKGAPQLGDCDLSQLRQWVTAGFLND